MILRASVICLFVPVVFAQTAPSEGPQSAAKFAFTIAQTLDADASTPRDLDPEEQTPGQSSEPKVTDQPSPTAPVGPLPAQASSPTASPDPSAPTTAKQRKPNCQHPANPSKRRFGCKDEDFEWDETITSDWNGVREEARKLGITISGSYYFALQTGETGGSRQAWRYAGQLTTALDFNFEKLLKIPGMSLYVSDTWGTGSDLTAPIGSVFPVNPNYAVGAYLAQVYLQQKLVDGNLTIAVGRLGADCTFANLPVFDNYVSYAINPTPISLVANDLSYTGPPPGLEWGAQAVYNITPVVQVAAGAFNTNPNSANNGSIFAFQQGNKGALVTAQASYLYNQGPNDQGSQGQYTVGFFEDNNSFATLPSGSSRSDGNAGVFLLGQQMVYRPDGPGTSRGLTVWAAWAYSPKQIVNPMPVFTGTGVSYEGLLKRRRRDIVSAAWVYGKTSQWIPNASSARLLETTYQWLPKRYLTVSPDFQYIWDPPGKNGRGAAVFGLQFVLTF
jgi:porin